MKTAKDSSQYLNELVSYTFISMRGSNYYVKTGLKNSTALSFVIGSTNSCDVFGPITMNTLFLSTDQKENKKQLDLVYNLFPLTFA